MITKCRRTCFPAVDTTHALRCAKHPVKRSWQQGSEPSGKRASIQSSKPTSQAAIKPASQQASKQGNQPASKQSSQQSRRQAIQQADKQSSKQTSKQAKQPSQQGRAARSWVAQLPAHQAALVPTTLASKALTRQRRPGHSSKTPLHLAHDAQQP